PAFRLRSPRQQQIYAVFERTSQRNPAFLRPFLARLGSGVQQDRIGLRRHARERSALEAIARLTLRLVAKRETGQRAITRDRMYVARYVVMHVIKSRGKFFADAVAVVAMTLAARDFRDK